MRDTLFRFISKHPHLRILLAVLFLLGLCVFNDWLFDRVFNRSYFAWYVDTGPVFGLITIFMASVWDKFEEDPGLIAKNPYRFVSGYFGIMALVLSALAPIIDTRDRVRRPPVIDHLLAILFAVLLLIIILGWIIFIIPLQYFVFLICGALPRIAPYAEKRTVAWYEGLYGNQLQIAEQPLHGVMPRNGWIVTVTDKPFKLTSALSAAFLYLLGQILNS